MTLTEFLQARIAEDEALARKAGKQKVAGPLVRWNAGSAFLASEMFDRSERTHIARFDPARVLAECEAKRRIVEACGHYSGRDIDGAMSDGDDGPWLADHVLHSIALPYADHADFQEEWKP